MRTSLCHHRRSPLRDSPPLAQSVNLHRRCDRQADTMSLCHHRRAPLRDSPSFAQPVNLHACRNRRMPVALACSTCPPIDPDTEPPVVPSGQTSACNSAATPSNRRLGQFFSAVAARCAVGGRPAPAPSGRPAPEAWRQTPHVVAAAADSEVVPLRDEHCSNGPTDSHRAAHVVR